MFTPESHDGVVVMFGTVAMKAGGITRAVLDRVALFAHAGIPVKVALTGFNYNEEFEEREIRKAWSLPDSVEFRYFWREAAPGTGGSLPNPSVAARTEEGLTSVVDEIDDRLVQFYEDGLLVKTKRFDQRGQLQALVRHDRSGRKIARDQFSQSGKLVYTDEIVPTSGVSALRRWYDESGKCWLTTWLAASGQPKETVRHRPAIGQYRRFGELVAEWLDDITSSWARPVVMADLRRHDPVLLSMRHPGVSTVAILHNCHTEAPFRTEDPTKSSFAHILKNLEAIDTAIVLTHRQRDDLVSRYAATNLTIINHPAPRVIRPEVDRQPGLLVVVARLDKQKRLDHAIRAFTAAISRVPEAQFHIYGRGSEEGKLHRLVAELGMTERIHFKGFTSRPHEVFASASATVLSSLYEGLPLVLTEAMGVGTPFVSYDVNYGPAEVIRHEVDGLLVPTEDIDALADAMVRVLSDPAFGAKLGERAREVGERFSHERWSAEWIGLHRNLSREPAASKDAR